MCMSTYFQVSIPSLRRYFAGVGGTGAGVIGGAQVGACQVRVVDIREEQLAWGAHLKLKVSIRVWCIGGYENFNSVFVIQWVIALSIVWYDLFINAEPSDVQELLIIAQVSSRGVVHCAIGGVHERVYVGFGVICALVDVHHKCRTCADQTQDQEHGQYFHI